MDIYPKRAGVPNYIVYISYANGENSRFNNMDLVTIHNMDFNLNNVVKMFEEEDN